MIGNLHPHDTTSPKLARQRREVAAVAEGPADGVLEALASVCRSHAGDGPMENTCVHAEPYGTCSSTLLRLGPDASELRYADGAPCLREYTDFTHLLSELDRESTQAEGPTSVRKVS